MYLITPLSSEKKIPILLNQTPVCKYVFGFFINCYTYVFNSVKKRLIPPIVALFLIWEFII